MSHAPGPPNQTDDPAAEGRFSQMRAAAVAGSFYPADPNRLSEMVEGFLSAADAVSSGAPKALIVPHAGYVYSGPTAGIAYARLRPIRNAIRRVILLGPSHRIWFKGLAVPSVEAFVTPLGHVPIDREQVDLALALPQVGVSDQAHAQEHSLEVQLPFLQRMLGAFSLVPFSVGEASTDEVAEVLELLWGGAETLIVISSDLSHYLEYSRAQQMDDETTRIIEALEPEELGHESACGRIPIRGLLEVARKKGLTAQTVDLRNSGDTAGSRDEVVGYGAYVFH